MKIKKISLSFASIIFAGLAWYAFAQIFSNTGVFAGNGLNWFVWIFAITISYGLLFLVALTKDRYNFWLTTLLSALSILVFLGVSTRTLICAAGLFVLSQVLMEFPKYLEHSIDLRYFSSAYSKIALVIIALIAIQSVYLQDRLVTNAGTANFSNQSVSFVWPLVQKFVGEFNTDATVNQFLTEEYQQQGINSPTPEMLSEGRQQLSEQVGFTVYGSQPMSQLGEKFVASKINNFLQSYNIKNSGLYLIFLSLLILLPLGRLWFAFVAMLLYHLFRKLGIVKVLETQVAAKTLEV